MCIKKEIKANLFRFFFKEREKQSERQRKETEEEKEITGEHDNISASFRIIYCL